MGIDSGRLHMLHTDTNSPSAAYLASMALLPSWADRVYTLTANEILDRYTSKEKKISHIRRWMIGPKLLLIIFG